MIGNWQAVRSQYLLLGEKIPNHFPSPFTFLIVEDVSADTELIVDTLESMGITFEYDVAQTRSQCHHYLQKKAYHGVLSDYRLPSFTGLEAFYLLQESGQDIPFILITGSLGEEEAVECIKLGVTDYVLKDRLFRLPTVLNRALQEFELRRQGKMAMSQLQITAWREGIINRIVQIIREKLDIESILSNTVNLLHDALGVTRCVIFQPDSQQQMRIQYVSDKTPKSCQVVGSSCLFYRYYHETLVTGHSVVVDKIEGNFDPELSLSATKYQIKSFLMTPLLYQQSYFGGIAFHQCDRQRNWTKDEITLVRTIADHCAIAIYQTHLYKQAETEITQRRQVENALRESEQRFKALIENARDMIVILDEKLCFSYLSPSVERILGYPPYDLRGQSIFNLIHPEETLALRDNLNWIITHPGLSLKPIEYRFADSRNEWLILEAVAKNLLDDAAVKGIVLNCHEITLRRKVEARLHHDQLHDRLTGLPNRTLLMDILGQALNHSKHHPKAEFAVLLIDLDRFNLCNDSLGHFVGDQLLIAFAQRLQQVRRSTDTIARLGGDEFVILLENINSSEEVSRIASRINQVLASPFLLDDQEVFISASIGIAFSSTHSYDEPISILRDADRAMYCAKNRGRARYEFFAPSMYVQAVRQLNLENDLRRAMERDELVVYYQPIMDLDTQTLKGAEALVRWRHPEQGMISPVEFIPIAEETGLVVALDQWVLRAACKELRRWQEQFSSVTPLTVSVNLSGRQFAQPDLIEKVDCILTETGLDPRYLKLEITETILIENPDAAAQILRQLRQRQIQVCLDDFGTGYSSLGYLHRFPLNVLKIDRSFVSSMDGNVSNSTIVRAIITMARELGIEVIAEGIETEEQQVFLANLGCNYGQGYWFSPPVDGQRMTQFIQDSLSLLIEFKPTLLTGSDSHYAY